MNSLARELINAICPFASVCRSVACGPKVSMPESWQSAAAALEHETTDVRSVAALAPSAIGMLNFRGRAPVASMSR
ncbi:hypothetical protein BDS110ZK25_81080 [Bradyrhizobium diazoefficiens]|jgi:hypothetical protein